MFPNRQSGSTTLVSLVGVSGLVLALMYAKEMAVKSGASVKEAKLQSLSEDAQILAMSNLALVRAAMNPAKISASLYEPAVFAENYFAPKWTMIRNDLKTEIDAEIKGQKVLVTNHASSEINNAAMQKVLQGGKVIDLARALKHQQELEILRLNPHPSHPYYIASVDVRTSVEVTEKSGTQLKRKVDAVGQIQLIAPSPNSIELEIRPASGGAWTTDFGSPGDPLPAGKYQLRLLGGGVVYSGLIESSSGMKIVLGLSDTGVSHNANNIHRKNIEIGVTEPLELGENKTFVVEMDPVTSLINIGVPTEGGGGITDPKVMYNSGSCRFSSGPSAPILPSGPVKADEISESIKNESVTTLVPGDITISASLTGVDGAIFDKTISKKVYVVNKVTTKRIQKTITRTKHVAESKGGDDGQQCASYCPKTTAQATGVDQWNTMWPYASKGDAVSTKMRDFVEYNNGYNGLPITGVSCVNYDLTAQKIMQATGAPSVDAIKNANNGAWWATFDQMWGGGGAKNLERYVAYVLPSCQRQIVGMRDACGCFDENTRIRMADGTERLVKDIRQGDLVFNPKTGRSQWVKRVIAGPEKEPLYELNLGTKQLTVTSKHPFLSPKGMKAAKDFVPGDLILDEQGSHILRAVRLIEADPAKLPVVWNIELLSEDEIDDNHYLSANGVMTGDLYLQIKLEQESGMETAE